MSINNIMVSTRINHFIYIYSESCMGDYIFLYIYIYICMCWTLWLPRWQADWRSTADIQFRKNDTWYIYISHTSSILFTFILQAIWTVLGMFLVRCQRAWRRRATLPPPVKRRGPFKDNEALKTLIVSEYPDLVFSLPGPYFSKRPELRSIRENLNRHPDQYFQLRFSFSPPRF